MSTKFTSDLDSNLVGSTLDGFKGRRKVAGCAKNTHSNACQPGMQLI